MGFSELLLYMGSRLHFLESNPKTLDAENSFSGRKEFECRASFLRLLARARVSATPAAVLPAALAAWVLQWRALATLPLHAEPCAAGPAPDLHELLADARWTSGRRGPPVVVE